MIPVNIRKQGASAVMTIPSEVLNMLDVTVGETVLIDVRKGEFTVKPQKAAERKRYSLRELLRGASPEKMEELMKETETVRGHGAVGKENG